MDVPFSVKYQDYVGRWRPYAYAGYAVHFRISSTARYIFENVKGEESTNTTDASNINFTNQQKSFNRSIVLGGGIKYKVGKNYLFTDLRLNLGLSNVTNKDTNLLPSDKDYSLYSYINDWYRLNTVQLLIGYTIPYYNPRKKSGWEPKGLLGKILFGNKSATK